MKRATLLISAFLLLGGISTSAQSGLSIHDRLLQQRESYPLERLYIHTDAEDYLQGDRIWLKAYLMDEQAHTPVDSTLYVYVDLCDQEGERLRQAKLLRRQGAFYGYLDIPEDFPSGPCYLRGYSRYMAAAPETAFVKRLAVGREKLADTPVAAAEEALVLKRLPHGFEVSYPQDDRCYLLVLSGEKSCFLGAVGEGRVATIPDEALPDGPLEFLAVSREGKVLSRQSYSLDRGQFRCTLPVSLDKAVYEMEASASLSLDTSALQEGELVDLSVSVICRPLLYRHRPSSIVEYVMERPAGFDVEAALAGSFTRPTLKESTSVLSGTVRRDFFNRPVKGARVSLISPEAGILDVRQTGEDGRFSFEGLDFPAGTHYLVKTSDQNGRDRYTLDLDESEFPEFPLPAHPYMTPLEETSGVVYVDEENVFGAVALEGTTVTATQDGPPPTGFNRHADYAITLRQIEERGYTCLHELLREVPGVFMKEERVYVRATVSINADVPAAIAIDGTIIDWTFDLDVIQMPDVARVDVFKTGQTAIWGARGGGGVISITTKSGDLDTELLTNTVTTHTKVSPLGYQKASDFFAAQAFRNRRTVYWNPFVQSDKLSFQVGDVPGSYLLVLEGVTSEGRLIHEERTFDVE